MLGAAQPMHQASHLVVAAGQNRRTDRDTCATAPHRYARLIEGRDEFEAVLGRARRKLLRSRQVEANVFERARQRYCVSPEIYLIASRWRALTP